MISQEKLLCFIDENKEKSIEFLRELISINSETVDLGAWGHEKEIQYFIKEKLLNLSFKIDMFEPDSEKLSKYPTWTCQQRNFKDRPNVVGTIDGGNKKSIILNGHVDTLPAGPRELWKYDPFGAEVVGDKLYGRGSCDMKAGVAAMIKAVEYILKAGINIKGKIILESVVGEEGGGNGTLACVDRGYTADAAIVTEPTSLDVQPCCRGVLCIQSIRIVGKSVHASMKWRGINAIEKMIKIINGLQELERIWLATKTNLILPSPTITIGKIEGGTSEITVPEECVARGEVKYLPNDVDERGMGSKVKEEVENWISMISQGDIWLRNHPPKIKWGFDSTPFHLDTNHNFVKIMEGAQTEVLGKSKVSGFPACCDARHLYNEGGTPTAVFGPGNLSDAHSIDEYVSIDQYLKSIKVLSLVLSKMLG